MPEALRYTTCCCSPESPFITSVNMCLARDIQRLWGIAGQRYNESKQQLQLTVGSYSIFDDLPSDLDQVTFIVSSCVHAPA